VILSPTLFSKPVPRNYQDEAANSFLNGALRRAIIQLATGCGKTLTAGVVFDRFDGRCLFLAHTDELVRQTCRAMLRMGLWPRVEKADEYRGGHYIPSMRERRKLFGGEFPPNSWFTFDKVFVSSMQTFATRIEKYMDPELRFGLLCIDEAHRARCRTYEGIYAKLSEFNPDMRLLGLTATPYRADKKNLGSMFDGFAYQLPILDAIDLGWLVDVRGVQVEMRADTTKWKVGGTKHGRDITDSSLRASMESPDCIESIAHPIIERGEGRKGIVFLPGIEASEAVAAALNALKPGMATFVHGKVPKKERRNRVRAFEDGEFQIMTGCQVFQEGFDVPDVSLVVMARPTQSRGLYEQMLGRGLRPIAESIAGLNAPAERRASLAKSAKRDCLIMDFVNNTKFKLASALDVLLTDGDPRKAEYVRKQFKDRDQDDKRAIREQIGELDSLFALNEALRTSGGPPPRTDFTVKDVNLYGAGGTGAKPPQDRAARPSSQMVQQAHQFRIDAERAEAMTAGALHHEIEKRKLRMVGRSNYGFLLGKGVAREQIDANRLNWHDAMYLRRLVKARPSGDLPGNWIELVQKDRQRRAGNGGA